MPHLGHVPGTGLSTPGHMGQKYSDSPGRATRATGAAVAA